MDLHLWPVGQNWLMAFCAHGPNYVTKNLSTCTYPPSLPHTGVPQGKRMDGSLMAAALPALSSLMLPNQETLASTDQITCFHCRNSILKGVAPCATRRQGEKRLLPQTVKSKRNRRSGAHSGFFLQFSLLIAFHLSFNYICTILTDNQG